MPELSFKLKHAIHAIDITVDRDVDWLTQNYPWNGRRSRRSSTGFLTYNGRHYPVKPLGRLAQYIQTWNPLGDLSTKDFRDYFENLGFELVNPLEDGAAQDEAAQAVERRLTEVLTRPGQAQFRFAVFELFDARCLITGCETLEALEAAHIVPVADNGSDEASNGIPLRADIHRLFDAGIIKINHNALKVKVKKSARTHYKKYHGKDLTSRIASELQEQLKDALRARAR